MVIIAWTLLGTLAVKVTSSQFRTVGQTVLLPCTTGLFLLCSTLMAQLNILAGFSIGIVRKYELSLFRPTRVHQERHLGCVGHAGKVRAEEQIVYTN